MSDVTQPEPAGQVKPKGRLKLWLKRIGVAGFFFFLIKGLVWIGVFVFVGKSCG